MSKMTDDLIKFMESDEGRKSMTEYVKKLIFKDDLKAANVVRIKKMFTDQKSFNLLVNKIIGKHNDAWIDRCHKKGVESYPWELMYTLFKLAEEGKIIKPIDGFTDNFPSQIYSYKSWQFAITHGQGAVCSIYYKKKLKYRG